MRKHQLLWIAALMALCLIARADDTQWDFLQFGFGPNFPDSQDSVAVYGARVGLPVSGGKAAVNGIEFAVAGALSDQVNGVQLGALMSIADEVNGVQISVYNQTNEGTGIQIGAVNVAKDKGFQFGIVNYIEGSCLPWMILCNFKF
ncbi:MAG: hypothetical protein AB7F32_04315 [Victivallaceae bacterium]